VLEEPVAQVCFDVDGNEIGADLIDPGQKGTPSNDDEDQLQPGSYLGKCLPLQVNTIDNIAKKVSLSDDQQTSQKS
jgi:hypothetical protein